MPKLYPLPGPVARSLEVVGDRWTLLVVRELLLGGRRWAELERALPGIPSNLLAERLRLLEEEQVVERAPDGRVYHLTDKGRDLAPVLASLAAWGTRHCGEPSSAVATHAGCGGRVARCAPPAPAAAPPSPPRPSTSAASVTHRHCRDRRPGSSPAAEPFPSRRDLCRRAQGDRDRALGDGGDDRGRAHDLGALTRSASVIAGGGWCRRCSPRIWPPASTNEVTSSARSGKPSAATVSA